MPRLSDSMEEGTIVAWLKSDGDEVRAGEPLVEIETDKATSAYEAELDGILEIVAAEGTTVALGQPIATIDAAVTAGQSTGSELPPVPATGERRTVTEPPARPPGPAPAPARDAPLTQADRPTHAPSAPSRAPASPVARRMAREHGIDLDALAATVRGRINKSDVEQAIAERAASPTTPAAPAVGGSSGAGAPGRRIPLTRVQTLIAQRMVATKTTVPEFIVAMTVDAVPCRELRDQLKAQEIGSPPSINDLIVRAVAVALKRHPRLNSSLIGDAVELHEHVNIGIAVATDDALHVPVVRNADQRSVLSIAAEARRLADSVRAGTVTPADLDGGTFTVSNLGMFGVSRFTAIINAPQAAILAVGGFEIRDGRHTMELTLTCDHRVVYGAHAAAFLGDVRALLENPLRLLVEAAVERAA